MTAMKDRTYYRQMPDQYLVEQGKESKHELCIALAERLEDVGSLDERIVDQQDTIDDLKMEISNLNEEIEQLNTQNANLEDEISALIKQLKEGQPK